MLLGKIAAGGKVNEIANNCAPKKLEVKLEKLFLEVKMKLEEAGFEGKIKLKGKLLPK